MKTLLTITFMVLLLRSALAQEVYKWEDEKGGLHYGDKPAHPAATLLEPEVVPYSNTGSLPPESPAEEKVRIRRERDEARTSDVGRQLHPSPSLARPKARLDRNGGFWLSGAVRNSGKGVCEFPAVEVVVFDDNGSVDGSFETAAFPSGIARGEEAQFEGKYLTPVGDSLSWDVIPRCGNSEDAVYGASKRGTLSLKRNRILRLRKFKTR
jgi:hypothetical protein